MVDSPRDEYLRGDIGFDEAMIEVTGMAGDRARLLLADLLGDLAHTLGQQNPPLSAQERQSLDEAGLTDDPAAAASAMLRSRTLAQDVTDTALTVAAAADRIGVGGARVRQLIGEGKLWAFDPGTRGGRRLPAAQFTAAGVVPYLDRILPHVPAGLHPVAVHRLLTLARPELERDGQPTSLVDWLAASGGNPELLEQAAGIVEAAGWEAA